MISLPQLRIGSVALDFPVVQAAMSGYSDWPMRVTAKRLGAAYALCEVMLEDFVSTVKQNHKNRRFLKLSAEEHPVGAQLMGTEPQRFQSAAKRLVETGFDVIDINLACPMKRLRNRCRGGLLLGEPETAKRIIESVCQAVGDKVPVTLKMRRGVDDSINSRDNFYRILDHAWNQGVQAVTVHGRTVHQKYCGPSNWAFLKEVKAVAGERVIIGSGDLFTAADCLRMFAETGVDGVSIARGSIGNPWIFREVRVLAAGEEIQPPTLFEQRDVILAHYQMAREIDEPSRCSARMRKFGIFYSRLHAQHEQVKQAYIRVRNCEEWEQVIAEWYAVDSPGVWPCFEKERMK